MCTNGEIVLRFCRLLSSSSSSSSSGIKLVIQKISKQLGLRVYTDGSVTRDTSRQPHEVTSQDERDRQTETERDRNSERVRQRQ